MSNKSFKNTASSAMSRFITQDTQEVPVTQDTQGVQLTQDTQVTQVSKPTAPRKKLTRINMGFTEENHDYIRVMSQINGKDMGKFVNDIIADYRTKNKEVYEQAKRLAESQQ